MANHQLEGYIQKALLSGQSKESIRRSLLENGWNTVDIEQAFQSFSVTLAQAKAIQNTAPIAEVKEKPVILPKPIAAVVAPAPTVSPSPSKPTYTPAPPLPSPVLPPSFLPKKISPVAAPMQATSSPVQKKSGHKLLLVILILLIIAVCAFGGWWLYTSEHPIMYTTSTALEVKEVHAATSTISEVATQATVAEALGSTSLLDNTNTVSIDPKLLVPPKYKYTTSSSIDIDKDSDGEKELVVFYKGDAPNVGFSIYKYTGGDRQSKDSWKQMYSYTTTSTSTPKITSIDKSGTGAVLITMANDYPDQDVHIAGWVVVTEKFSGIVDDSLYAQLPFMTTRYTRVDPGKATVTIGGFTQVFTPYNDDGIQSPITVHFTYKNGSVTESAIDYQ